MHTHHQLVVEIWNRGKLTSSWWPFIADLIQDNGRTTQVVLNPYNLTVVAHGVAGEKEDIEYHVYMCRYAWEHSREGE